MPLDTTPNLSDADDFYEALINAHQDLTVDESQAFNARLVLLLANHIGDLPVLLEALQAAEKLKVTKDGKNTSLQFAIPKRFW